MRRSLLLALCAATLLLAFAALPSSEARGHANHFRRFEATEEAALIRSGGLLRAPGVGAAGTEWFEQKLDHFTFSSTTWQQRYHTNFEFYKAGGPVFLYLGGEAELTASRLERGFIVDLAKEFGGAMFALEHRYYGQSHPFAALETENMVYLTVEQALEDAAQFIREMNVQHKYTAENKWVTIGGSYPGVLSGVMRLKYPNLVAASLASSAPIRAAADFWEYDRVVGEGTGQACANELRAANRQTEEFLDGGVERAAEVRAMYSCENTDAEDHVGFLYILADAVSYAIQYTNSNPASANYQLKELLCDRWMLNTTSAADPLQRFAGFFKDLVHGRMGDTCEDFTTTLKVLQDTSTEPHMNQRQWYWQSCLQWGFFQIAPDPTIEGQPEPVRSTRIDLKYHYDLCRKAFGGWDVQPAIEQTNARYGGLDVVGSRVLFTNGNIDPWTALGLVEDRECCPSIVPILINGTAHCADLSAPDGKNDPKGLTAARETIRKSLRQWLQHEREQAEEVESTLSKVLLVLGSVFLGAGLIALCLGIRSLRKAQRVQLDSTQPTIGAPLLG